MSVYRREEETSGLAERQLYGVLRLGVAMVVP